MRRLALGLVAALGATPAYAAPPAWTRHATIYEVNTRQYSAAGNFAAVTAALPRLKAMGITTIWMMPIQPIGVKNRKGTLGSYYSIRDYTAVNPEFGTLADFRALVARAHALKMRVIIDWVANHTAWDHHWVAAHPGWYKKDANGQIGPYTYDPGGGGKVEYWSDVVGLDYRQPALRRAMIDAMKWWVVNTGIDGFRCDVAGLVPVDFWEQARTELDAVKPMFMLAEGNDPKLLVRAFDAFYGWDQFNLLADIAKGTKSADDLRAFVAGQPGAFPSDAYRMIYTTNHDENSWRGTDQELFGAAWPAMAVLAATLPGIPLVYSGQEAGNPRRLAFFEKDPIAWRAHPNARLYRTLLMLKRRAAFANGAAGAPARVIDTGTREIFAFRRGTTTIVTNLSARAQTVRGTGRLDGPIAAWGWRISP